MLGVTVYYLDYIMVFTFIEKKRFLSRKNVQVTPVEDLGGGAPGPGPLFLFAKYLQFINRSIMSIVCLCNR